MFGLTYFMAKFGRLRCIGLDIVEGPVKTVDVFDKSISGGKADLIFQNARCKERMRKLCVFRDGIYLSRLVMVTWGWGILRDDVTTEPDSPPTQSPLIQDD
jgi:hypothetical protein